MSMGTLMYAEHPIYNLGYIEQADFREVLDQDFNWRKSSMELEELEQKIKDLMYTMPKDMRFLDCKKPEDAEAIIDYYENEKNKLMEAVDNLFSQVRQALYDYKDNHYKENCDKYNELWTKLRTAQSAMGGVCIIFFHYYELYLKQK